MVDIYDVLFILTFPIALIALAKELTLGRSAGIVYWVSVVLLILLIGTIIGIGEKPTAEHIQKVQIIKGGENVTTK